MGLKKTAMQVSKAEIISGSVIPPIVTTASNTVSVVRKERDFDAEARGKTYSQQYAAACQGLYACLGMLLNTDNVTDEQVAKVVAYVDKVADAQARLVVERLFGVKA